MGQQEAAECALLPSAPAAHCLTFSTAPCAARTPKATSLRDQGLLTKLPSPPPCCSCRHPVCHPLCVLPLQVHARWVNLWARRVMASPEQALVPLKERDALLASKHEVGINPVLPVPTAA